MKVDKSVEYHTVGGRVVYGGGGIIPDVFVPMDTTKASRFYVNCNKKATAMRFASWYFDNHKKELSAIDDYQRLLGYLDRAGLESAFLEFAKSRDGLVPDPKLWAGEKVYMMTQVKGLVGRYSKLGDKAYYHIFLQTDETFKKAMSL
jgi:carboxyl-terminal processing protease